MTPRSTAITRVALAAILFAGLSGHPARAARRGIDPRDWHAVKCERYGRAWSTALSRVGPQGLGRTFLDRHAAFLASGCTRAADVCPRSPQEFALANIMVMMSMNFGAASTFVPFACP